MTTFLTARANVAFFGKPEEKEDIVPIEYRQIDNTISFSLKKTEFVLKLIDISKVFAINEVFANQKQIDICEITEGAFKNKFTLAEFQKKECRSIDCPCISGASVFECQYVKKEETENEVKITGTVLLHKK